MRDKKKQLGLARVEAENFPRIRRENPPNRRENPEKILGWVMVIFFMLLLALEEGFATWKACCDTLQQHWLF